jgi:hypothetical protein
VYTGVQVGAIDVEEDYGSFFCNENETGSDSTI